MSANTKFSVTVNIPVRFSDTDAMGHVNNSRYFSYMEESRVAYARALFPDVDPKKQFEIFPFILAHIACDFKAPAFFGETLCVGIAVTEVKNSSFVMAYEIKSTKDDRVVATGDSVLVMYDYKAGKSVPIPEEIKSRIRAIEGK